MAKISGPLMSNSASGMIGERLTFSQRASGQQARFQRAQKVDAPSWAQADQQSLYRVAYARWLSFSDAQRLAYDVLVTSKNLKMSGWNYFLKLAISDPLTYLGLLGYWTFNRPGFGTILDISKNSNVGTLYPVWPGNCPQYVESNNKKLANALSFDGIDDYVSIPDSASLRFGTGDFTISFFMQTTDLDVQYILAKSSYQGVGHWSIRLYQANSITFRADGELNGAYALTAMAPIPGAFTNVVYKRSGNDLYGYLNGVQKVFAANIFFGADFNASTALLIGKMSASLFNGLLDDIRFYNRALSGPEILNLYRMFV